jgi:Domain of unknown function (DUF4166)
VVAIEHVKTQVSPETVAAPASEQKPSAPTLVDLRFRTLIGETAWARLPEAVCRRFSKCLAPEGALIYQGEVVATELSRLGRILAFLARAVGSPLPLTNGASGPALVVVTEDERLGGQSWTRIYTRPGRRPQTVHSAKRFRGPTGLEEYVGYGIGMALEVTVEDGALVFRSDHYFLTLGRWRVRLPRLLVPGGMCITHREEGGGAFSFRLTLTHPRLGCLVHQLAYFRDP